MIHSFLQHSIRFVFMCACVVAPMHDVYATQPQPEWETDVGIDYTAFRTVLEVPAQQVLIPSVVEVPIPQGYVVNRQGVAVGGNAIRSALVVSDRVIADVPVTLSGNMLLGNYAALSDARIDTTVTFPFEEGQRNQAYIVVTTDEPITTSELRFVLAPHVSLPRTVSIQTVDGESITGTVVAPRALEGTVVRFPETTARTFTITFDCVQPLRLAELSLIQQSDTTWTEAVRFLAQPNTAYQVYLDPDRVFGSVPYGGDLAEDADVVTAYGVLANNPAYVPSDIDSDGVPDERDNCVQVSNVDQADIDRNARGDACDDFDRDGKVTAEDNCPDDPNWDQSDTDGDGQGDVCDRHENRFTERNPLVPWVGLLSAALVLAGLFVLTLRKGRGGGVLSETTTTQQGEDVHDPHAA